MGISTPKRFAKSPTAAAQSTPSATWPKPVKISGNDLPAASSSPTRRLRERSPVAVNIKSPAPVRPIQVSDLPPAAFTKRIISARPRVRTAARAFKPKSKPSPIPAAIANTFLTAPPSSTPTTSSVEYTRILP